MIKETFMRRVFWAAALFNIGGAIMLAFPALPMGALAGLPAEVPAIYRALVSLFVLLFGGMYAYLAQEPTFTRPLIWLGAIGKGGAFACALALWLLSEVAFQVVLVISGDLVFAALFLGWLVRPTIGSR